MNRSTLRSLGFVVTTAAVALAPHAASAQSAPDRDLTVEQARSEFIKQGFQADPATRWWTSDGVVTFRVSDPASDRMLMVLVYPDRATADLRRANVYAQEAGGGAHLVPGYGLSTWRGNVALVESTREELNREYAAELDRDNQVRLDNATVTTPVMDPTYAVDLDFLTVLDQGIANL